jgi:Flp pilus assembly protein CpaB
MLLRRAARTPFVFWLVTCAIGATTGLVVSQSVAAARATARRYGTTRPVVVTLRALEPGHALEARDVEVVDMPRIFVPPGALASEAAAGGRAVVVALFPGEIVLDGHLSGPGGRGLAAMLPPGTRAIAVPLERGGLKLRRGDIVDVLATFDDPAPTGEPTFPVAVGATVLDTTADSATVAVTPEEAARVAYALAKGEVTLAVSATRSRAR